MSKSGLYIFFMHPPLTALDPDCCAGAHIPGANVETRPQFSPQAGEYGDGFGDSFGNGLAGDDTDQFAKALRLFSQPVVNTLRDMTVQLEAIGSRVKKIEDQPLPLGTTSVRVVEKSENGLMPSAENLLDRPGALEALADAAIRRAQAQPMRTIPGVRPRRE